MRLLNCKLELCYFDDNPPPYAILSHTWSENNEDEVTLQDLQCGTTNPLLKLELCREWTKAAKLDYFWIDTCCIDKRNDAEISYAIRSMWRWYSEATICFVYLSDLSKKRKLNADWRDALKNCRWFTRGWTLQELVASKKVEFYAGTHYLGSKEALLPMLKTITGINLGDPLPDHATRLSWVAKRITKRPEDKAYCMLGICDVSLSARYGEGGASAWRRLQSAIARRHVTVTPGARAVVTNEDHRATVLDTLRFSTLETRRRTVEVAVPNTCEWILGYPACAKWLELEHKFFWIKGKPGAGNSVLVKYLDQHVTQSLETSTAASLYFYFNARGEQLERSFMGLYRSLIVQLVSLLPHLAHELDTLDTQFDLLQLQRVLTSAILGLDRRIWLFIDALDECREDDVQELIDFLDGLQEAELYVCLASRHYPTVKVPTTLQLVLEEVEQHKQDLSTYVEKLDLEGEELAQMKTDVVGKANGIFLWVVLVVGILQKDVQRGRFHAMQARLREIPEGLQELFRTIILRDNEHKDEFLLCLRWIMYASRPLALKEWYFAMMAGIHGASLQWRKDITDHRMETFLRSSSKGLVELTKGEAAATQFIHESVRDFLIYQGGFEEICDSDETLDSVAHEQLKRCCLRGMTFDLTRQLESFPIHTREMLTAEERRSLRSHLPFAEYATTYILHHADQAAVNICQDNFLANEFTTSDWYGRINAFQEKERDLYYDVPSLSYICAQRDLTRLIPRPADALSFERQQRYETPIIAAIMHSSWGALRLFLHDINAPDVEETIAELECKVKTTSHCDLTPEAPSCWTLGPGLVHLSKYLLSHAVEKGMGAHVAQQGLYRYALHDASKGGREQIVHMLLDAGADIASQEGPLDCNALCAASSEGHSRIVQLLLHAGANVDAEGLKRNALQHASELYGNEKLVQILLDAGADVNAQGPKGSALQLASQTSSNEKVMQTLLAAGADVDAQGPHGTALQLASSANFEQAVPILLAAGADVNAQGPNGSALLEALREPISMDECERVVSILLTAGADVSARGRYGTALQMASSHRGAEKVVQMLIDAGAGYTEVSDAEYHVGAEDSENEVSEADSSAEHSDD